MCQIFLLILSGFICSAMRITTSVTGKSEGGYSKGRRNLICLLPLFLEVCILKTSGSPCVAIYKSLQRTFVSSSSLFIQSANRMTTGSIFWKVTKKAIIWVESSGNWHPIYTSDPLLRASCRIKVGVSEVTQRVDLTWGWFTVLLALIWASTHPWTSPVRGRVL